MTEAGCHEDHLAAFRADKRRILELAAQPRKIHPATRDAVVVLAAWLDETNDRLPRLLAGGPPMEYDEATFEAIALEEGGSFDLAGALGWFRRTADRFETMAAELTSAEIADEPEVDALLHRLADVTAARRAELDTVLTADRTTDRPAGHG